MVKVILRKVKEHDGLLSCGNGTCFYFYFLCDNCPDVFSCGNFYYKQVKLELVQVKHSSCDGCFFSEHSLSCSGLVCWDGDSGNHIYKEVQ